MVRLLQLGQPFMPKKLILFPVNDNGNGSFTFDLTHTAYTLSAGDVQEMISPTKRRISMA